MPADGISLPPIKGTSARPSGASRRLGYINGAAGRNASGRTWHYSEVPAAVIAAVRRTDVMERGAGTARGSIRFDAHELHDLTPFLCFVGDELSKVGGRADKRCASEVSQPRLDFGIGEARVDLLVELLDDLGWRGLRCADAEPGARLVARHKFAHGRDVRQCVRARRGGYCERAQPTSLDMLN